MWENSGNGFHSFHDTKAIVGVARVYGTSNEHVLTLDIYLCIRYNGHTY